MTEERLGVADRALKRSLASRQSRYEGEVRALIDAGIRVLRRKGFTGATVGDILEEAGLSSRAFYRHFPSKSELMLAVFERDAEQAAARLRARREGLGSAREQLEAWIDDALSLGYDSRRAPRTRLFTSQSADLGQEFGPELAEIHAATMRPLVDVLERGRRGGDFPNAEPEADARSVFAVTWSLIQERLAERGFERQQDARAYVLRFCLPALGARP